MCSGKEVCHRSSWRANLEGRFGKTIPAEGRAVSPQSLGKIMIPRSHALKTTCNRSEVLMLQEQKRKLRETASTKMLKQKAESLAPR